MPGKGKPQCDVVYEPDVWGITDYCRNCYFNAVEENPGILISKQDAVGLGSFSGLKWNSLSTLYVS